MRAAALTIAALQLGQQAWRAAVTYAADPRNPYVYAQTVPDAVRMAARIRDLSSHHELGLRHAALRRIVHQGWTDALRALHPAEDKLYTFWDYTAGAWQRDAGFRIDHLLCSPPAADRLQAAGVDKWARGEEKASDHAPTWVELS